MSDYTKLIVTNDKPEDVEVYVIFAAANPDNQCAPTPATVEDFSKILTKVNDLMGKFTLGANSSQEFDPQGKCFSGAIGFYIEPQCPVEGANFNGGAQGTSIAEFTLNPTAGCDEAFDISCVNGVNCFIQMSVDETSDWHFGPNNTSIGTIGNKIYNKGLQLNAGNPGVFPVNCTDCIRLVNQPPCPTLPIGPAQEERICNIQRSGRGGVLTVTLTDPQPA